MPRTSAYVGREICLTTRHGKEMALALPFSLGLGASLSLSPCNTDQLGTFSGEVERLDDAINTCRRKALMGLEQSGLRLGLASEASFGPHPAVPMLAAGQARRLCTPCPRCSAPGWGLLDISPGLPCRTCGTATELTATEIWGCVACGHQVEQPRRDGLSAADPGHCPWCNP